MTPNEQRFHSIRLAILRIVQTSLQRETVIQTELAQQVSPPPLLSEMHEALRDLESRQMITGLRPQLGGPVKWFITDQGRVELSQSLA
jgi:hypothetical protein